MSYASDDSGPEYGHFNHVFSTLSLSGYLYLGVVHKHLLGQHVPAGVRVEVGVLVQQP